MSKIRGADCTLRGGELHRRVATILGMGSVSYGSATGPCSMATDFKAFQGYSMGRVIVAGAAMKPRAGSFYGIFV